MNSKIDTKYLSGKEIPNVNFKHNTQVRVMSGEYKDSLAYTVSLIKLDPEPLYLLETWDGRDIQLNQSEISEVKPITSEEINIKVLQEINNNWNLENAHGVDLKESLIFPKIIQCKCDEGDQLYNYWLVLNEIPDSTEGYKIIYDDESGLFGLAYSEKYKIPFVVGLYGTFIETFKAM